MSDSNRTIKMWGTTLTLISNDYFSAHLLNINQHGFSSVHYHSYKYNMIYVYKGQLKISFFGDNPKSVTLIEDQQIIIEPNVKHQFYADAETLALEFYWPHCPSEEDIVRIKADYT